MTRNFTGYLTISQIAAQYGYTRATIRKKLAQAGIVVRKEFGRSFVSPPDQRRLAKILKPKAEATLSVA